jgi:hypothetical protein
MKENYYTFLICILRPVTVEESLRMMGGIFPIIKSKKKNLNNQDMVDLRNKGMTFKEIGEIFGITETAAYMRVKRFTKEVSY